jgi:hypothetical protein
MGHLWSVMLPAPMPRSAAKVSISALNLLQDLARDLAVHLADTVEQIAARSFRSLDSSLGRLCIDVDARAAMGAGHLFVRAQPSEAFLRLAPAVPASDRELLVIEEALGHLESSIGGRDLPMVGQPGEPVDSGSALLAQGLRPEARR